MFFQEVISGLRSGFNRSALHLFLQKIATFP